MPGNRDSHICLEVDRNRFCEFRLSNSQIKPSGSYRLVYIYDAGVSRQLDALCPSSGWHVICSQTPEHRVGWVRIHLTTSRYDHAGDASAVLFPRLRSAQEEL